MTSNDETSAQRWRLLLIEDNPADIDYFLDSMEDAAGICVEVVQQARLREALTVLAESNIDIVVLDLSLPDSQGLGTLEKVQEAAPEAALVVLSGLDDEGLALDAVKRGAQDYITKGEMTPRLILRALRYAMERKRNEIALREKNEQLESLLRIDPLTGLLSRRYGLETLDDEMERWRRYHTSLAVLMIDLDDFKKINDEFSHSTGDAALRAVAEYLTANLRASDKAVRYGGDEFLIILPNTDARQLENVCQKLQMGKASCQLTETLTHQISLSIGGAVACGDLKSTGLIDQADLAMLMAKKSGKARYHINEPTEEPLDTHESLHELRVARNSMRRVLSRIISTLLAQVDREGDVLASRQDQMISIGRLLAEKLSLLHNDWQTLQNAILLTNFEKLNLAWEIATRPSPLSPEQESVLWETLKKNIRVLEETGFLEQEAEVLGGMYEWFDGTGKPSGLRGESIPLLSRALALVSAYTLLREGGPHTLPHSKEDAMAHLEEERGTHFDPAILDALREAADAYTVDAPVSKGERLLLVEDHPPVRSIMTRRLVAAGYEVEAVATAQEARQWLRQGPWYAILVDLMLPGTSGFSLFGELNAIKEREGTPWAVLSARFDRDTIESVRQAGAFGYIVKPIRFEALLKKLKTCHQPQDFQVIAK